MIQIVGQIISYHDDLKKKKRNWIQLMDIIWQMTCRLAPDYFIPPLLEKRTSRKIVNDVPFMQNL